MKRQRTIYYNDARHYYLFVFEPPMALEDAWRPIDEVAGTGVDTFVYGADRGDGLFYPPKVGQQFKYGEHLTAFRQAAYWRVWHNMKSLSDRGLDPLRVLIDRAHEWGMDFFASIRLGSYGGMEPSHNTRNGGRGFLVQEVRDHVHDVLEELATQYPTEGVELDFAASPGGGPYCLRPQDVEEGAPVITQWVQRVSTMVRGRSGGPGQVGARVYPTEDVNQRCGLDVRRWIEEGLVDFVVPMVYSFNLVDSNMPIEWLTEAARGTETSVYPIVQPNCVLEDDLRWHNREFATPQMMAAAAANFHQRGADGLYCWFLDWPLGATERHILTLLANPRLLPETDKHYFLPRRTAGTEELGYQLPLPLQIEAADTGTRHALPLFVSDDIEDRSDRIRRITLRVRVYDLVSRDRLSLFINGASLAEEACLRQYGERFDPYNHMWLEFDLRRVRPRKGENLLEIRLDQRVDELLSPLKIDQVELKIEYGVYPSKLNH